MRKAVQVLVLVFAGGCTAQGREPTVPAAPPHTVAAEVGSTFRLGLGETALVDGLYVRFDAVAEESRCPADVVCVWMGNARVALATTTGGTRGWMPVVLNTGQEPRGVTVGGYALTLEELQPHPSSSGSIEPADYVALLKASRTPPPR